MVDIDWSPLPIACRQTTHEHRGLSVGNIGVARLFRTMSTLGARPHQRSLHRQDAGRETAYPDPAGAARVGHTAPDYRLGCEAQSGWLGVYPRGVDCEGL